MQLSDNSLVYQMAWNACWHLAYRLTTTALGIILCLQRWTNWNQNDDLYGLSKTGWNTLLCYIDSCSHWLENPLGFARDWKFGRRIIYCHDYAHVWPDDRPEKCHLTSIQLNGSKSDGWDICWSFLLAEVAAHGSRNWCTASGKGKGQQ